MSPETVHVPNLRAYAAAQRRWTLLGMIAELLFLLPLVPAGRYVETRLSGSGQGLATAFRAAAVLAALCLHLCLMVSIGYHTVIRLARRFGLPAADPIGLARRLIPGNLSRSAGAVLMAMLVILWPTCASLGGPSLPVWVLAIGLAARCWLQRAACRRGEWSVTPLDPSPMADELGRLASRCGIRGLEVLLIRQSSLPLEFAAICQGNRRRAVVFLNAEALKLLEEPETLAVFAHELSHLRFRRTAGLGKIITWAWWTVIALALFLGLAHGGAGLTTIKQPLSYLPGLLVTIWVAGLAYLPVSLALTRREERLANRRAVELTGRAGPLISAIRKLSSAGTAELPSPWWERLLFADCLSAKQAIAGIRRHALRRGIPTEEPVQTPSPIRV